MDPLLAVEADVVVLVGGLQCTSSVTSPTQEVGTCMVVTPLPLSVMEALGQHSSITQVSWTVWETSLFGYWV